MAVLASRQLKASISGCRRSSNRTAAARMKTATNRSDENLSFVKEWAVGFGAG